MKIYEKNQPGQAINYQLNFDQKFNPKQRLQLVLRHPVKTSLFKVSRRASGIVTWRSVALLRCCMRVTLVSQGLRTPLPETWFLRKCLVANRNFS